MAQCLEEALCIYLSSELKLNDGYNENGTVTKTILSKSIDTLQLFYTKYKEEEPILTEVIQLMASPNNLNLMLNFYI